MIESLDKEGKFFFKELTSGYLPYPDFCGIGMIRPYVCEDGYIYACSSFILRHRKLEPEWRIGHITDVKGFYERANKMFKETGRPYDVPIDKCRHCLLSSNNKFLHNIVRDMEDKNFA
jgi:radical SAM protein with 4Fe4S-binding SPASM domain